jgi:hypothetical protein
LSLLKTATSDENQYVQKIALAVTSRKERVETVKNPGMFIPLNNYFLKMPNKTGQFSKNIGK